MSKAALRVEDLPHYTYDDYAELKSEKAAKEAGKMRQEGKEYVVADGDVMLFRFNV